MSRKQSNLQRTLSKKVNIRGTGLHSGDRCEVILHPAEEDTGIVFIGNGEQVAGLATNVVETARGTTLGYNGTKYRTIEHLMAALNGLGVDNSLVEVLGPEMPALDGSSMPYVEAILSAGTVTLHKPRNIFKLTEPVYASRNDSFILAVPSDRMKITYVLKYDHPMIGLQTSTFELSEEGFTKEIAPARTFVMYEEIAALLSQHLARGGSIDNAIVIWQDRYSSDLRFKDELSRHKILDIIGDLALIGGRMNAEILAVKSGHALNVVFAQELMRHFAGGESKQAA
ncbi:MAG: UDP-3-O-acyl-N-acetylglucosamine deacetylase [Armatimonadota bacterium]